MTGQDPAGLPEGAVPAEARECRRPITAEEYLHLRALGARLARLRASADLTVTQLATRALLHPGSIRRLERGHRRPRATTLERISAALVLTNPQLGTVGEVAAELADLAGPALAPESAYADRVTRRRRRRYERPATTAANRQQWSDERAHAEDTRQEINGALSLIDAVARAVMAEDEQAWQAIVQGLPASIRASLGDPV